MLIGCQAWSKLENNGIQLGVCACRNLAYFLFLPARVPSDIQSLWADSRSCFPCCYSYCLGLRWNTGYSAADWQLAVTLGSFSPSSLWCQQGGEGANNSLRYKHNTVAIFFRLQKRVCVNTELMYKYLTPCSTCSNWSEIPISWFQFSKVLLLPPSFYTGQLFHFLFFHRCEC